MFFQAHPDDLINCAYLIHWLSTKSPNRNKNIIKIVSSTKGEFGLPGFKYDKFKGKFLAKIRTRELINELKIHNILPENIYFLDFIDGFVEFNTKLVNKIYQLLNNERPDVIIAPEPYYTWYFHKDHVNTGKAVLYSIKYKFLNGYCPKLYFYGTLAPNFYFPVYDNFELIKKLIECHKTQSWLLNNMKLLIKPMSLYFGLFSKFHKYVEPYRRVYFKEKNKIPYNSIMISLFCYKHQRWYNAQYPKHILEELELS